MGIGQKIIEGLKEAAAGDFARVTIEGETWAKVKDIHADQQEIMRINNDLRQALLDVKEMLRVWDNEIRAVEEAIATIEAIRTLNSSGPIRSEKP